METLNEAILKLSGEDQKRFQNLFDLAKNNPEFLRELRINFTPLDSYVDTVSEVFRLAYQYPGDVSGWSGKPIYDLYNYVRLLPYYPDPVGLETISRFVFTKDPNYPIRDCDDKTVPILSFAILKNIPCRAVVCGKGKRPHHIYPEIKISGNWYSADATYPLRCVFGQKLYGENFREEFYLTDFIKKF